MAESIFKQGMELAAAFTPLDSDNNSRGGATGYGGVTRVYVDQARGPMGFYDVAVVVRDRTGGETEVVPLHMCDDIRFLKVSAYG